MSKTTKPKKTLCWITPDYFLNVDSVIVPLLANEYDINWIIINTKDSKRKAEGIISDKVIPTEVHLAYKQRDPRIIFQFIKLLRPIGRANYDLIYLSFHGLPYFFPIFFSLINLKNTIYGAHNVSTPKGASNEKLMRIYHRYAFRKFQNFQVFSKFQLDVIKKILPGKKHYYSPIPLKDYGTSTLAPPNNVIRFLFFGYIRGYKRLDLLLKSFQEVYNSGTTNIELYVAGNCENWKPYESIITNNSSIITRLEIIPDKDIPDLISSCHYMVLPYQDGAQSGVLTLAYQYNKPVIISDIESFKQFVTEGVTGFSFENGSHESLTKVMKKVIREHNANYTNLKNNVKALVDEEFVIDKIVDRYKRFLNDCMQN